MLCLRWYRLIFSRSLFFCFDVFVFAAVLLSFLRSPSFPVCRFRFSLLRNLHMRIVRVISTNDDIGRVDGTGWSVAVLDSLEKWNQRGAGKSLLLVQPVHTSVDCYTASVCC